MEAKTIAAKTPAKAPAKRPAGKASARASAPPPAPAARKKPAAKVAAAPKSAPLAKEPAKESAKKPAKSLSEAEILKASDKDYMNASQMMFFKLRLQGMEQEILRNAGETTEHLRESIIVPDPADRATIEEEHALELRTRDRERKLLKKIQQSIHRIDSGEYGYCEETGDPIGIPRLLARPTATLSLEAQERREMKQRMFGE